MKKIAIILLSAIALYGCGGPAEPKKLLSEKQMEDILYDMSVLQAIKSFTPQSLDSNKVDAKTYIFKKYKIDSLTLAQNHLYYAHDLEAYKKIQQHITERLKAERDKLAPKKPAATTKPGVKSAGSTPSAKINTPVLSPQQKARAQQKRDSVRNISRQRLSRSPKHKTGS